MMTNTDSWNDEQYELYSENLSASVAPPAADEDYSAVPQSSGFESVTTGRLAPNLASLRALRQLKHEELNEYKDVGELKENL